MLLLYLFVRCKNDVPVLGRNLRGLCRAERESGSWCADSSFRLAWRWLKISIAPRSGCCTRQIKHYTRRILKRLGFTRLSRQPDAWKKTPANLQRCSEYWNWSWINYEAPRQKLRADQFLMFSQTSLLACYSNDFKSLLNIQQFVRNYSHIIQNIHSILIHFW